MNLRSGREPEPRAPRVLPLTGDPLPAVKASGVDFSVLMHDPRHAYASWLLAEGSDLKSVMERMGHAQIQTTQQYLHALPEADRNPRRPRPSPAAPPTAPLADRAHKPGDVRAARPPAGR